MTFAPAVISSTVSPRTRSAIKNAPICAGVASPARMVSKACVASAAESVMPLEIVVRKGLSVHKTLTAVNSGLRLMRAARFWIYTRYFQKIARIL